jgi:hypothetical protein
VNQTSVTLCLHDALGRRRRAAAPLAAALAVVAVLAGGVPAAGQPVTSDAEIQFVAATQSYASMHRRLETLLGPIEINSDMARIDRAVLALATAITAERPNAARGDFFSPALAGELRARIAAALAEDDLTANDLRAAEAGDGVDPSLVTLRVNGPFPWGYSSGMFKCLIDALPPLPTELQYRIVGDTLVLIDVHASLIVDLLPSALAPPTVR